MRNLIKTLAVVLCFGVLGQAVFAENIFTDIENSPYKNSINSLAEKGIIQGYGNGEFRPQQEINRAELLKIIFQILDQNVAEFPGGCFPDVQDGWFAPFVCKAKELAIVKGYPDGLYRPGQSVNMVEAMKIAIESFDFPTRELKEGEKWFLPYVNFVFINNLFSKYAFAPDRPARREEIAFLADEFLKIQKEERALSEARDPKSAGCGKEAPSSPPTKFMVGGVERSTITVIPESYDKNTPVSLVFAFHGRTNSNQMVRNYYGIEKPAEGKAIFVYPAGTPNAGGYSWGSGDYEFFDVMLAEFRSSYCIDVDHVFAVGHSLGAWFTNSLACARGDKLRAVATLGGARSTSKCSGPVAAMQWHNPKDEQAAFSGALTARDDYLKQNQCSGGSEPVEPAWGNCVKYTGCYEDAPVIFCPHNIDNDYRGSYYPHTWPKGTGEEMWKFFQSL